MVHLSDLILYLVVVVVVVFFRFLRHFYQAALWRVEKQQKLSIANGVRENNGKIAAQLL